MGIENSEFHGQLQSRINERAKSLAQRLLGICSVDGREADKNGLCPVCKRVVTPPPSDEEVAELDEKEPSADAIQAAAKRLFYERLEKQRAEQEEQAKPRTRPEDEPKGRNWADVVDQHGNVRHW